GVWEVSGGEEWVEEVGPEAKLVGREANLVDGNPARIETNQVGADASPVDPNQVAPDARKPSTLLPKTPAPANLVSAKDLLNEAQQATAQGDRRRAASLYDEIRKKHRADPRAALAAFELGRIRLDVLADPAGAEEAFRDAVRLAREPNLRDDAEARQIE